MARDTRRRMVATAAALLGSRGVRATSFSEVLARSRAPRGSIYHHFPGGKKELMRDAMDWLKRYERFWSTSLDRLSAYAETKEREARKGK